jgi:hypothetical protein
MSDLCSQVLIGVGEEIERLLRGIAADPARRRLLGR